MCVLWRIIAMMISNPIGNAGLVAPQSFATKPMLSVPPAVPQVASSGLKAPSVFETSGSLASNFSSPGFSGGGSETTGTNGLNVIG